MPEAVEFNWAEFWNEPGRLSTFDDGPLSRSYYQKDHSQNLVRLFSDAVDQIRSSGRVLDVGCGNGAGAASLLEAADLKQRSLTIDAVDSAVVRPPDRLACRVLFRHIPAENLDYPDNTFALILSCFSLEFFDSHRFITECQRLLEPGGQVVFLTFAKESPAVSMQSRYVGVYQNGLRELIRSVCDQRPVKETLTAQIRSHIEADVPQPHFRTHLNRLVDCLTNTASLHTASSFPIDHRFLPDVRGQSDVYSLRSVTQFFTLMQVIGAAAFSASDARMMIRRLNLTGFDICSVTPLEFQERLLCWLFRAEKPRA